MLPIRVSPENLHRLQTADGAPLFLLGDTAWELFHRLTLDETDRYLTVRAAQGFACVWAVALAEFDGLRTPNRNGDVPFEGLDPDRPVESYWRHVDAVLGLARGHGLRTALLPTWGDKVTPGWGDGPAVFDTAEIARRYGGWLGRRYAARADLVWVLGGDRPASKGKDDWTPIWRAMAEGLRAGGARGLMTYHPQGGRPTASELLQGEAWLDVYAMQSGHGGGHDVPVWDWVARDLALEPPRPTLDAEPNYEDHPVDPWPTWNPADGHFDDLDVRRQAYRSAFAGGCGVTYGHHSVWQFASDRQPWVNHPLMDWEEALRRPGAESMRHLRALMEGEGATMVPAPELLVEPGEGPERAAAMRGGGTALVYRPTRKPLRIEGSWDAARIDPRTGGREPVGRVEGELPGDGPSEDAAFLLRSPSSET